MRKLLLLPFLLALSAHAAPINIVGFEGGGTGSTDIEVRSYNSTFALSSSIKRSGGYSLRINPTTTAVGNARIGTISSVGSSTSSVEITADTVYTSFFFRVAALPSADEELAVFVDNSGGAKSQIRITSTGALKWCNASASCGSATTATVSLDTWYEIAWESGTGASAAYSVSLYNDFVTGNGTSRQLLETLSGTGDSGANTHGSLRLGKTTDRNGSGYDIYYDDIIIDTASAPPPGRIVDLAPDSEAGSGWTGGTGTTYTEMDERPTDSDTTYWRSTATGTRDVQFVSAATAGVTGVVNAVKIFAVVRDEGGTSSFRLLTIISSSSDANSNTDPGASYVPRFRMCTTDIDVGGALTTSSIDNLAVRVGANTATALRASSAGAFVHFSPPTPTPTPTNTPTATPTATNTPTATPTNTPASNPLRLLPLTGVGG